VCFGALGGGGEDFGHLGQSVEHVIVSHSGLMCR
jgi:hypothetical protein